MKELSSLLSIILTLKEKRNRKSRKYIAKLGFDQHSNLNSAGKSSVTAHLESHLGKGPRECVHCVGETSNKMIVLSQVITKCMHIVSSKTIFILMLIVRNGNT